jgi:hypothetical protein
MVALFLLLGNPGAAGERAAFLPALVPVLLAYTAGATILWPVLYAGLRFFASRPLRLSWFSLRYTMGFHVVNAASLLAAGWMMLSRGRGALGPAGARRLGFVCAGLSVAWIVAAVISLAPWLRRQGWAQLAAAGLALSALLGGAVAAGSAPPIAAPAVREGSGEHPVPARFAPARRLILLNFDGADLDSVLTLQAHGKLPAFSRLMAEGAYGRLTSLRPCVAPVTRTTLVTGRLPHRHGVRGERARRIFGRGPDLEVVPPGILFDQLLGACLRTRPLGLADRSVLALWEIAARAGGHGGAAGWEVDLDREGTAGPPSGAAGARLSDILDPEAIGSGEEAGARLVAAIAAALGEDARSQAELDRLLDERRPGVVAVSFPGLDRVAHLALRYARPGEFANVTDREVELYGEVLERYYGRIDGIVGRAMERAGPDAVLFVTSSHGISPVPLAERLVSALLGAGRPSGTHADAPGGFLFARGPDMEPARLFGKGSLADVVPTALYALNLPLARDLDGAILAGVFTARYTFAHPVTVLRSYETAP